MILETILPTWAFFVAVGTILILIFGQLKVTRWVLVISLCVVAFGLCSELWTNDVLKAPTCVGNILKGLHCPDPSLLVKLAIFNKILFVLSFPFVVIVMPLILVWLMYLERSHRKM